VKGRHVKKKIPHGPSSQPRSDQAQYHASCHEA
jgi:hypothetical protein